MTANLSRLVNRFGVGPDAPDDALLARFAADRDEAAFTELVRRHGGRVFGVCRRVTGDHHLAEDAFQAVFVVLARKAASLRPRSAVAAWLRGVAFRTSLRARTTADRRRRREQTVETLPEVGVGSPEPCDAVAVLDEEIAALPEPLRLPVVLCELEGGSRADVARRLGIPEGTLSSRLASARKTLAGRLRNRGVALSATLASTVPPGLCGRAVAAALHPGCVPARVAELSSGVVRTMYLQKLKFAVPVAGLLALAAWGGGFVLASPADPVVKPAAGVRATKPQPAKAAAGPNTIVFYRNGSLTLIDPDGKNDRTVAEDCGGVQPRDSRLSPDGKQLAVVCLVSEPNAAPAHKLFVRGVGDDGPGTDLGVGPCMTFAWSPDGTEIVCSELSSDAPPVQVTNTVVNVKTKEKTALKLPKDFIVTDWSRDGGYFVTSMHFVAVAEAADAGVFLMNRDGTEHMRVTEKDTRALGGKLSPDGKKLLCQVLPPLPAVKPPPETREFRFTVRRSGVVGSALPTPGKATLVVVDVASGKVTKVEDVPLNGELQGYCWSPDGKKIAYAWREKHEGKPEDVQNKETESFLVVCDPDGKNARTIATEKGESPILITIAYIDWR
jgi:RNA polymerase sigma factor (sigma-70 family)